MGVAPPLLVDVSDASSVGEVRRRCADLTARLGFDETAAGRVAIIATEIASNLVRHATEGRRVLVRGVERGGRLAVELLAIDAGPGIDNVAQAMRDGYTTGATPGTGLGAVRRLADEFELFSVAGVGTVVLARVDAGIGGLATAPPPASPIELGVLAVPKPGEPVSGDAWAVEHAADRSWVLVVDGLGHGPDAARAARAAVRAFERHAAHAPADRVRALHDALGSTRGAAVGVAEIRTGRREVVFAGLGNIAAAVVTGERTQNMISHDGIAGHVAARIHEYGYPWPENALLIMQSDGLSQRWDLARYPGLARRDPSIVAAVLFRDCARGRDDATVLVARDTP
jgi:anti-sigma regulatory factor (Ser/Thr protein kinase)